MVSGGEGQYPRRSKGRQGGLATIRPGNNRGFLSIHRGGTSQEAVEGIDPARVCIELYSALPEFEIENSLHVWGGYLRCIHGWAKASNPTVDCTPCNHLGSGPEDGG